MARDQFVGRASTAGARAWRRAGSRVEVVRDGRAGRERWCWPFHQHGLAPHSTGRSVPSLCFGGVRGGGRAIAPLAGHPGTGDDAEHGCGEDAHV